MLPKDLPDCRVLTFSYPASVAAVFGRTSSDTILQHATTLVQELAADRQIERATERPIIFLCHSLGGIIVKRALIYSESRKAKKSEHIHSIFVSTYGIMFFGTPHHGSSKAILANYVQRMVDVLPSKVVDTDSQLLEALREGSEILQDITDNFQPKMKSFHVFFFWEQEKSNLGVKWDYIVAQTSAAPILDDTDRAGIKADHRRMCKFATRTSPGYRLVVATLMRYSEEAPNKIGRRWVENKELVRSMRKNEAKEIYDESD
ncbi:uncharacterized protein LDX57_000147 [Aspergillus melleus]|uniref:uncharacterized protein n=1 Tax=Aspergillus melleus TaxID=138277 RepID=UPI001E8DAD0F|nr:uncharacterized protein LDX57_000147 [Aspergillus melleus]KAH8422390.1 hypothetical protein LDX57_000147 [Aspergillus melleus]